MGAPTVPSLVEARTADDIIVGVRAAEVLGRIGPDAVDAAPALENTLEDPDAEVRREARKALERIPSKA
jgi:HEAT repeat protein